MTRSEVLIAAQSEFYFGKLIKKLKTTEFGWLVEFIKVREHLSSEQFELSINRWFLDSPNKPKSWTVMCELASLVNTRHRTSNNQT